MGDRTPLFSRHTPGGVFTIVDLPRNPGDIFFVDSTNSRADDSVGAGRGPDTPLATLLFAVSLATAAKGDVIFLMPGHAETIATATAAVLSKSGVTVIGLGRGALKPTFTLATLVGATISVTAANVGIHNIKVISARVDITAGITAAAGANGLHVSGCEFTDGGAALELVIGISLAADCDNVLIEDNRFYTVPAGGCASAVKLVGASDRTVIRRNTMLGDYSAANIDGITAAGTLIEISDNVCQNIDTTAGLCVNLNAATTGAVVRNHLQGAQTNTPPIVAAGVLVSENYTSAAVGESGIVRPDVETYA